MFEYLKYESLLYPLLKQVNKYSRNASLFDNKLKFSTYFFCTLCKKNKIVEKDHNFFGEKMFRCNVCKSNAINVLDTDMFQIFDIDYSFEIDKKIIENNYKEMIKSSHPDVNENIDIEVPTHVIRNYKLLNDPFERALLIISKKMNTSRERLIDEIDSLPVNLKVMDDVFDKDMKIKEIETGDMKKYNLTSIIESNNAKINQYIESLKVEFRKESLEVVKILKILKELRIYQKLNVKLSGI